MPPPRLSTRGTADRATENPYALDFERLAASAAIAWRAAGDQAVPFALADGLETQRRFDDAVAASDLELAQVLAQRLLAVWDFLVDMSDEAPRAADGALLCHDGLKTIVWAPKEGKAAKPAGYPTRPSDVSELPPFFPVNVREWLDAADGTGPRLRPVANAKPKRPIDPAQGRALLDGILADVQRKLIDFDVKSAATGSTPIIARSRRNLSLLTLQDIERATHVRLTDRTTSLLDDTRLFLFHGAYFSVVLDADGEPTYLNGLRSPILVPEGGHPMRRFVPSPGLYVSVQKFGFSTFRVDGSSISKVLFGGVGGFQELFLAGITDVHPIQQAIQADLDHLPTPFNYIAGIALESVADPTPITAQHIREKLPTMVKLSIPYAVDQLKKMASVEGLEEIAVEVIEQVVLQVVLKKAAEFIIEKVGTKFIPVVNIAFSVYDVVSAVWYGMDEMKRVVDAICALALALGGKTVDEDTIAAKVLGRIMADEFKDEVVQALTKYAAEHATGAKGKPKEHAAPKSEPAPPPPAPAMPEAHPSTPHAGGAPGITGGPQPEPRPPAPVHDQPAAVTQGVVDPATSSTTTGEKAASTPPPDPAATTAVPDNQTRGVGDRKTETAGAAAPETKETGTDTRGTEAAGTDTPATDATGTASKPPAPKRKGTKKKKVELPPGVEPSDAPDAPIMQIGVHDRSDAPLRSGRKLQEARPESGGQMGFQTQIGPELVTAIGSPGKEVKVTSLNPDVLIGADTVRFRDDALAIIVKDDKHPMRRLVDQDKFRAAPYGQHGDMTLWKQHPYDWQSGHAQSHRQGGADVIVFQTRYRNQKQSALLERHGFVTMDEVFVIGGIGVEKRSAWDLFHAGYLDLTLDQMKSLPTLKL